MSARVLCVGAAVLDTIYRVDELPRGEGKILPTAMLKIAEGMAASAACAIARLGGEASLWSAVGDDPDGLRIRDELGRAGVEMAGTRSVAGARSAQSTILVDPAGERLIVVFFDPALHAVTPEVAPADLAGFDAVLVDVRWPDLAERVLLAARAAGIPAILDGDTAPLAVLDRLARVASDVVFSEPGAAILSGAAEPEAMLEALSRHLPEARFCITFGARGCYWPSPDGASPRHQPALQVEAVDTLAAGDAFHGAFALALAEGQEFAAAIRLGSVVAALKCTVFGGRTGMPTRPEALAALEHLPPAR